ncbi:hypothetical protein JQ615_27755 [Bradyrhizobium jicamae]|uniref:Uncharacterized protein n=1 Tax=Bradyrhizobium jicamae TaxID=280332 RepID=A0ABS5FQV5_9BRAD|nr:hypothetical protein [Bradyrhizobium jicamae]MBR0799191.1 hypothetical protein [Bradyrhizobium jicamae]
MSRDRRELDDAALTEQAKDAAQEYADTQREIIHKPKNDDEDELRQLHERVQGALKAFSIVELRQLVEEIEELAKTQH